MENKYTIRHLSIDFSDHKIESNGVELNIDFKAVEVLEMLVKSDGQTVTIDAFMDKVWANKPSSPEVVTSAIARLRKLFKKTGIGNDVIITVHKVGYKYEQPAEIDTVPLHDISTHNKYKLPLILFLLTLLVISIGANINQYLPNSNNNNNNDNEKLDLSDSSLAIIKPESLSNVTQIYILRHAEKNDFETENPRLSAKGVKHAYYWKKVLQYIAFERVFTTDFFRNLKTAEILTEHTNIETEIYYPMSFEVLKFIEKIKGQKVLIIGHSNTIPDMVNRIIDEIKYPPMSHENYNLMYIVTISENGDTSSSVLHIEMP